MNFSPRSLPRKCKILVIRLRSIGDVVLNTPVLENLKRNFPECRLSVLVESPFDAVLEGNPFVDEIIIRDKKNISQGAFSKYLGDIGLVLDIRKRKFDLVLDFHGGPRAANLTFLSGARWKMGHKNSPRRWAYNLRVTTPSERGPIHTIKDQLGKLACMGLKTDEINPGIWVSEVEESSMERVLVDNGISRGEPYAVIHPGILKIHLRWQPEKMARIADHVQMNLGVKVVFVSMKEQIPQVKEITDLMKSKPISLAGKTDLRQLIVLLKSALFLVCQNGGQMHLSAAVGVPVLALFGASNPIVFGPVGEDHQIFYKNLPCSPCAPKPQYESCLKGEAECKTKITAEEIIEAIDRLVEKKGLGKLS